jgi:hypothetical protein
MGIRETLNRQGKPVTAFVVLALLICIAWIFYSKPDGSDPFEGGSAFFSVDDGKTFFEADASNIPPFMHEGREAVQALVYSNDGGKTQFVGYLMRFTPSGVEYLRESRARAAASKKPTLPGLNTELQANTEVKRPGEKAWVRLSDIPRAAAVMTVHSPSDPTKPADPVDP